MPSEKCGKLLQFTLVAGQEVRCTEDLGHEKPYRPECSCGRHEQDYYRQGTPHSHTITWGTPDPLPEENKN